MKDCEKGAGRITGLAHIGIRVTDLDGMLSFLEGTLGFEVTDRHSMGDTTLVFLHIGTCLLELVHNPAHTLRPEGVVDHICVEVEDIEALTDRLKGKGVRFLAERPGSMPDLLGGVKNIFLEGPEGLKLEFFEYCGR